MQLQVFRQEPEEYKDEAIYEAQIISSLSHSSIIKFIGYNPFDFNHHGNFTLITEYLRYGTLENILALEKRSICPKSWCDTKKVINIFGITSGMSYSHSKGIV